VFKKQPTADQRLVLVCSRSGIACQEPCHRAAIPWRHEVACSTTGSHTLRDFCLGRVCEAVDRRRIAQCVGLLKKGCAHWPVVATAEHTKMDDGRLVLEDQALPARSSRPSQGEGEGYGTPCIRSPSPDDSILPTEASRTDTTHRSTEWTNQPPIDVWFWCVRGRVTLARNRNSHEAVT
jgi:hypothetical protein